MANNVGFDLGTTNSALATYDEVEGIVKPVTTSNGINIASVAWKGDGDDEWEFGHDAKVNTITQPEDGVSFREFKILLTEKDQEQLHSRGYSDEYDPKYITKRFTEYCLDIVKTKCFGGSALDHLVICAPEVWNSDPQKINGRPMLQEICRDVGVKDVRVVSEPCAASAYFAYRYQKEKKEPYRGRILIIDYGGGTLDLTLVKVYTEDSTKMKLKVEKRTGTGSNENSRIGKAGAAYQEAVIRHVAKRAGIEDKIEIGPKFFRAVDKLERVLLDNGEKIKSTFEEYGTDDLKALDSVPLTPGIVKYGAKKLDIRYGDLVRAYDEEIRPVLEEQLNKINQQMDDSGISYDPNDEEDVFRVELAGGFGNFYLVREQVMDKYKILCNQMQASDEDREYAVAYGASLLASDVVELCCTAPYSIGLDCHRTGLGKRQETNNRLAFRYGEDIVYDHIYYQKHADDGRRMAINICDEIKILYNNDADPRNIRINCISEKKLELLLSKLPLREIITVGFSLDRSEVLTLHFQRMTASGDLIGEVEHIRLSCIGELLMTQEAEVIEGGRK